ncbi:MAG: 3'-5' exonuclease [Candidatus Helarchaeota archaeon]
MVPLIVYYDNKNDDLIIVYNGRIIRQTYPLEHYIYTEKPMRNLHQCRYAGKDRFIDYLTNEAVEYYKFIAPSENSLYEIKDRLKSGRNFYHTSAIDRILIDSPDYLEKYAQTSPIRLFVFDIEVYQKGHFPSAERDPIISIAVQKIIYHNNEFTNINEPEFRMINRNQVLSDRKYVNINGEFNKGRIEEEASLLTWFLNQIITYDPDILVGYYSSGFDIPYIFERAKINLVNINTISRINDMPVIKTKYNKWIIPGRILFDVYFAVRADQSLYSLASRSLKDVAKHYGYEGIILTTKEMSNIGTIDSKLLKTYNIDDVIRTVIVMKTYLPTLITKAEIFKIPINRAINYPASYVPRIMQMRMLKRHGYLTCKNTTHEFRIFEKYQAAYVDIFRTGMFHKVYKVDFSSYYPSIIRDFNLSPETCHIVDYEFLKYKFDILDETEYENSDTFNILKQNLTKVKQDDDYLYIKVYDKRLNINYIVRVAKKSYQRGVLADALVEMGNRRNKLKGIMKNTTDKIKYRKLKSESDSIKVCMNSVPGDSLVCIFGSKGVIFPYPIMIRIKTLYDYVHGKADKFTINVLKKYKINPNKIKTLSLSDNVIQTTAMKKLAISPVITTIRKIWKVKSKSAIIKFTTKSGRTFEVTGNHGILVAYYDKIMKRWQIQSCDAADVKPEFHYAVIPHNIHPYTIKEIPVYIEQEFIEKLLEKGFICIKPAADNLGHIMLGFGVILEPQTRHLLDMADLIGYDYTILYDVEYQQQKVPLVLFHFEKDNIQHEYLKSMIDKYFPIYFNVEPSYITIPNKGIKLDLIIHKETSRWIDEVYDIETNYHSFWGGNNGSVMLHNSMYGYNGLKYAKQNNFAVAMLTSALARDIISSLVMWLEENFQNVIEIDTDGIYLNSNVDLDVINNYVHKYIREKFGIEPGYIVLDKEVYNGGWFYKAKNYVLKTLKGDWIIKGSALHSTRYSGIQIELLHKLIDAAFKGKNLNKLVYNFINTLRTRSLEDFILKLYVRKTIDEYDPKVNSLGKHLSQKMKELTGQEPQIGDIIEYVKIKGGYDLYQNVSDISQIDFKYYEETLMKVAKLFNVNDIYQLSLF